MQYFRAEDMRSQADLIQEEAMKEPVFITRGDRFALVVMSMQEYDRLRGRRGGPGIITELPESLLTEIEAIAEELEQPQRKVKRSG
jgi:hypothetical protein